MVFKFPIVMIFLYLWIFPACETEKASQPIEAPSHLGADLPVLKIKTPSVRQPVAYQPFLKSEEDWRKRIVSPADESVTQSTVMSGNEGESKPSGTLIPVRGGGNESSTFTVKAIEDSGLLGEGGSDIYYSYMKATLRDIHAMFKNNGREEKSINLKPLKFLCGGDISQCIDRGLNIKKLSKQSIMRLIFFDGFYPSDYYETEKSEVVFVFRGRETTKESIDEMMKIIDRENISKILINLSKNEMAAKEVRYLSSQIKKRQMNLYIMGRCTVHCAHYLIPAANTVIIEPYGYIGFSANSVGINPDIYRAYTAKKMEIMRQFHHRYFTQDEVQGLVDLFDEYAHYPDVQKIFNFRYAQLSRLVNGLVQVRYNNSNLSIWDLRQEQKKDFLGKLDPNIRNAIKSFFVNVSEDMKKPLSLYMINHRAAQEEIEYYKSFGQPKSNKDYSYLDFIILTTQLVKNELYMEGFPSIPRSYYRIPEKDKTYQIIFPEADILRDLGANIQGENHMEVPLALSRGSFLFLSSDDMKNCNFFGDSVSFSTETLKECLSMDGSL